MLYSVKYWFQFKSLKNDTYLVQILENQSGLTSIEVTGFTDPAIINYPETTVFEPIKGSGCDINLFSTSNLQFINLYTEDYFKYIVKIFENGVLYWKGYLDSEQYSEEFNSIDNYPVSFSATDGLALLNRLYYLQADETKYTGITSQWNTIFNCLYKLEQNESENHFYKIYVSISTTSSELTLDSDETIFHKTYCRDDNWYNEDDEAETCRTVIEKILQPYGCYLINWKNSLYITDVNTILSGTGATFKSYYFGNKNYIEDVIIDINLGDLSDIGFANTSSQLNIIAGKNKQVVKYSPYRTSELLNFEASNDDFSSELSAVTYGSTNYRWQQTFYASGNTFDRINLTRGKFIYMEGIDTINDTIKEYYLLNTFNSVNNTWADFASYSKNYEVFRLKEPTYLIGNENYSLKIEMQVYPRTMDDLNNETETSSVTIKYVELHCDISIGDKHLYTYNDGGVIRHDWIDSSSSRFCSLRFSNRATVATLNSISDTWTSLNTDAAIWNGTEAIIKTYPVLIPLTGVYGYFNFSINGYSCYSTGNETMPWTSVDYEFIEDLRINDIKFTIVDSNGNEVEKIDIEYTGKLNKLYKDEAESITTFQGTNYTDYPIERAAMLSLSGDSYSNIKTWNKLSATGETIENLLLRSLASNFATQSKQITCTLNKLDNLIGYLTYNNYLTEKYIVLSNKLYLENASNELTIQEIKQDSLNILKEYN